MTRNSADVFDFDLDDILIAIGEHFFDELHVARFFALGPKLGARAAPVSRLAGAQREGKRLGVNERKHQHFVGDVIRGDAGKQAIGAELGLQSGAEFDVGIFGAGREDVVAHEKLNVFGKLFEVIVGVEAGAVAITKLEAHGVVADDLPALDGDTFEVAMRIATVNLAEHVAFALGFGTGGGGA